MTVRRTPAVAVLLAFLVLASGCTGLGASANDATTTVPSTEPPTTTQTTSAAAETTTTDDTPPKGTEFVQVTALENQSKHEEWPDERSVQFQNLSDSRQQAFLDALENDSAEFGPEETNPFSYHDDSRPRVVNYDGTWYFVRVVVV